MKGHEKSHSKRFKTIGEILKKSLVKTEAVREQFGSLEEKTREVAIDNFVET